MIDAGERPTFFRGAEFSRLVILAGLVLAGIPLAIYYGYVKQTPPPPERAPIAQLPPLPPPDSAPELQPVLDDSARNLRDDEPLAYLFAKVRKVEPSELAKQARREVTTANLLVSPKRYRGLPVRIEGYATTVFAVDDVDPDIAPSGRFYEVWFYDARDEHHLPCVVLAESVPKTLPGGRDLNERVAVEGYFLKLQKFSGGNGRLFHAPMLVGRIAHDPSLSTTPGGGGSRSPLWTILVLGLVGVYVMIRLILKIRKTTRPIRSRSQSASFSDQIAPEDLHKWIAQEKDSDEEDSDE